MTFSKIFFQQNISEFSCSKDIFRCCIQEFLYPVAAPVEANALHLIISGSCNKQRVMEMIFMKINDRHRSSIFDMIDGLIGQFRKTCLNISGK